MAVLEPTSLPEERMDSIAVPSLAAVLATIPDFRAARGKRHGLLPTLLLVCVATLCGARSQAAIAGWGRDYGAPWLRRLGFTRGEGPSQSTLCRLFQRVPYASVEAALRQWAERVMARAATGELEGVALDGKTLRGSRKRGAADAHLLAALSQRLGVVLGQMAVPGKTNEIGAADAFLLGLVLEGRVVTADALLTQRALAQTILDRGGDYLLVVKDNQPTLRWDIEAVFSDEAALADTIRVVTDVSPRGGRLETRRLAASTALVGHSDWPGLAQVLRLDRRVVHKATGVVRRQETAYAVTSLAPDRATPAQLLALWRGHWHVENQLHWVRDVTFDEDRSQVRAGTAPQAMAAFRNVAIGLFRLLGERNIAAATRRYAARPALALAAVGLRGDFE
jgi:predicted transposase YbfD/YdcC